MNNIERNRILISSLSKSEKRSFKLFCATQSGEKSYLQLFESIENSITAKYELIFQTFSDTSKNKNIEIASDYLYKQLLDFLVYKRNKKNIQPQIFDLIEKSNVLFDCKLRDEALETLNEAKQQATLYEDDIMQIIVARTEMHYLQIMGFPLLPEKKLVEKQMKLLGLMKFSRTINQYHFLKDILNHRLLHKK